MYILRRHIMTDKARCVGDRRGPPQVSIPSRTRSPLPRPTPAEEVRRA